MRTWSRRRKPLFQWSIGRKLTLASLLMILLAVLIGGTSLWQAIVIGRTINEMFDAGERMMWSMELLTAGNRLVAAVDRMVATRDASLASTEIPVSMGTLKFYLSVLQDVSWEGTTAEWLTEVQENYGELRGAIAEVDLLARQEEWERMGEVLDQNVRPLNTQMAQLLRRIARQAQWEALEKGAFALQETQRAVLILWGMLALTLVVALGWRQVVFRQMSRSIEELRRGVARISGGDLAYRLSIRTGDEIEELGDEFNKMAEELAGLIGTLEERVAERTRDLERRAVQLAAAAEVAREAAAIRDVGELLDRVVHLISDRFGFYHAGVFLVDDLKEYAVLRAASSEGGQRMLARGHRLKVGEVGIVGWVAGTGQPRIALDVGEDAVFFDNPDLPLTRSEMALPLKVRGEVIGVLDVQSEEAAAFSEEDVAVLQTMADQIALAIENARLLEESQRALRELESLYGQQAREAWAEYVGPRLLAYRYTGVEVEPAPVAEMEEQPPAERPVVREEENGRLLIIPVRLRGQAIGSIVLRREPGEGSWSPEDLALVEDVSDQIALALESARLLEETQQRAAREQALSEVTARFTRSLDMDAVLHTAVRELGRLLNAAEVSVYVGASEESAGGSGEAGSL